MNEMTDARLLRVDKSLPFLFTARSPAALGFPRGFAPREARHRRNGGVIDNSDLFEGVVL
ncbi:MAG: hypothetical protein JW384_01608 [Nitrosomonadaceae bacterium]|nr:hypothetical protein [Nitrosomonadaceae bacterium]